MNARRRTKPDGLPSRAYKRNGSFHWVRPTDQKWIKLCRIDEGETRMYERLADEKRKVSIDVGERTMPRLVRIYMDQHVAGYAPSYRAEWERRGEVVRTAFANFDIELVDVEACEEFLTSNWGNKLSTQRAMKAWLQLLVRNSSQASTSTSSMSKFANAVRTTSPRRSHSARYDGA